MIQLNTQTVAGTVTDIQFGRNPLPWMLLKVQAACVVWDRKGRRAGLWTHERIILQGEENVKAYSAVLRRKTGILAVGQRVPAFCVANDSGLRGTVLLASVLQVQNPEPTEVQHD